MSSDNNETRQVQIAVADPTPLGLFGLSVVTFVASMQKLGVVSDVSWVIPWALVCGSFAQLLAAYFDFCHKNIFGASIFGAFGFFWSGVAMSWMIKAGTFGAGLASGGRPPRRWALPFLAYFMFACIGTIAAAEANTFLFVDMLLIDVLLCAWGLIRLVSAVTGRMMLPLIRNWRFRCCRCTAQARYF